MKKVLIANRGEIALRIIRACRNLGLGTVAVCSTADRDSLHTRLADESVCIGPAPSKESYLDIGRLVTAARLTGADAVHPGAGFLSENAAFAKACAENGLVFVGPPAGVIAAMGDKPEARNAMRRAGIPVVPGTDEMHAGRFAANPRHVEVQVLADAFGSAVALGERDCSVQRNRRKLIEESPSPALSAALRAEMCRAAAAAAKAAGYANAGAVEFLLDRDGRFYFMGMSARIQAEHGVTELVTGLDLIEAQLRIAAGERLWFAQRDVRLRGHAIECRINAESPEKNFRPCPGTVTRLHLPGGNSVRVDTALYPGCRIPAEYDSLIAKVLVHGENRASAIRRMRTALGELVVEGVATNADFQYSVLGDPVFQSGNFDAGFLEAFLKSERTVTE